MMRPRSVRQTMAFPAAGIAASGLLTRSSAMIRALKGLIAGLGGRLVCAYVTTGQYDVALVVEMPNGDAMTKLSVALMSRGNVRTTTVRAFLPEEFAKLAAEAP